MILHEIKDSPNLYKQMVYPSTPDSTLPLTFYFI